MNWMLKNLVDSFVSQGVSEEIAIKASESLMDSIIEIATIRFGMKSTFIGVSQADVEKVVNATNALLNKI